MYKYEANNGPVSSLNDYVEITRNGTKYDGIRGKIGGYTEDGLIALLLLDKPSIDNGYTIVSWPVVCLKLIATDKTIQKWKPFTTKNNTHDEIQSKYVSNDTSNTHQYIIWDGGKERPVKNGTTIMVKLRGGMVYPSALAEHWPQICWKHRPKDDEMNKWDIVAYKVIDQW